VGLKPPRLLGLKSQFYVVGPRHYPWWVSVQVVRLTSSLIIYLKYGVYSGVLFRFFALIMTLGLWGFTVIIEAMAGNHGPVIVGAIKFTFILFVASECMFFVGIFWCYLDRALSPCVAIGCVWPPFGIYPISPYGIPLFNTVVLLRRGVTLTWAHNALLLNANCIPGIAITISFAGMFEYAQYLEYSESTFSMSDSIYGSIFYFGTGFHGLHVIIGHLFLIFNAVRVHLCHFSRLHHVSFDCCVVYWHFVDVVWLFLYFFFYWWPH